MISKHNYTNRNTGRTLRMLLSILALEPHEGPVILCCRTERYARHGLRRLIEIAERLDIPFTVEPHSNNYHAVVGGKRILITGCKVDPNRFRGGRFSKAFIDHAVELKDRVDFKKATRDCCGEWLEPE